MNRKGFHTLDESDDAMGAIMRTAIAPIALIPAIAPIATTISALRRAARQNRSSQSPAAERDPARPPKLCVQEHRLVPHSACVHPHSGRQPKCVQYPPPTPVPQPGGSD